MTESAESVYMFAHALTQQAAYDLMLPSDRALLHRYTLKILEADSGANAAELALHALHAQHGVTGALLVTLKASRRKHLLNAAQDALSQYRHSESIGLFQDFLETADPSPEQRVDAGCRLSEALYRIGKPDEAITHAEEARAGAEQAGDPLLIARATLACGMCRIDTAQHMQAEALMRPAAESLKRLGDTEYLPRALARLSSAVWLAGRPADAFPIAEEAAALARRTGNESVWFSAHLNSINMLMHLGKMDQAMERVREIEPRIELETDFARQCTLATTLGIAYDTAGDLERAARYYALSCKAAREAGLLAEVARALTNLGGVHHSRREFSQALKCQVEAEQIAREIGDRRILWYAVRGQAATFDETQDFHAGMERNLLACRIADAAGLAEQAHEARVWAACDYLNLHQPEEALELLAGALGYNAHSATGMRYASMGCSVLACAKARLGRAEEAQAALERAEALAASLNFDGRAEHVFWLHNARVDVSAVLGR